MILPKIQLLEKMKIRQIFCYDDVKAVFVASRSDCSRFLFFVRSIKRTNEELHESKTRPPWRYESGA